MERTVRKPRNIAMTLASVLLCLVLTSSYLVAGMLAKFATEDMSDDSSRVAKFAFNVKDGTGSQFIDLSRINKPGDSETYSFSVQNASEVSVQYDITLSLNGNMPLNCTINKGSAQVLSATMPASGNGTSTTKHGAGSFTPSAEDTDSYTLTVEWPSTANNIEYASFGSAAVLKLTVSGYQVD